MADEKHRRAAAEHVYGDRSLWSKYLAEWVEHGNDDGARPRLFHDTERLADLLAAREAPLEARIAELEARAEEQFRLFRDMQQQRDDAEARGRAAERADVVAWMRGRGPSLWSTNVVLRSASNQVAEGQHVGAAGEKGGG
jgi:hypothetical protein